MSPIETVVYDDLKSCDHFIPGSNRRCRSTAGPVIAYCRYIMLRVRCNMREGHRGPHICDADTGAHGAALEIRWDRWQDEVARKKLKP